MNYRYLYLLMVSDDPCERVVRPKGVTTYRLRTTALEEEQTLWSPTFSLATAASTCYQGSEGFLCSSSLSISLLFVPG